jgi:hypothetical protein
MGIDVAGEAPPVVGRPNEGKWMISAEVDFIPAAEIGQ